VQEAFLEINALQCGYCTPGMILAAVGLLSKEPNPSRDEIARHLSVNVCRCGVYSRILTAVEKAAKRMQEASR
jgi:aerobic-type carbon monoxide dehydrogenase small subunit (CoxS/CutS family)